MTFTGKMRLHFNRHNAAPLVACISTNEWELSVSEIRCLVPMCSVYAPKATDDDEDGKPSFWFEVEGVLTVDGSVAFIRGS